MKFTPHTVRQSLSPGHRKDTVPRARLEHFKQCLKALVGSINPSQDEEYHKTHVREFLMDAFYKGSHPIHNYGKTDLAIHKAGSAEGNAPLVLFELKRPGKSADFPDRDNLNCKALHELVLYYLRERIDNGNHHIRRLVITNAEEWFVFDALDWDRLFFRNTALVRDYKDWKAGKRSSGSTDHFYKHIASPAVINLEGELPYAHLRVGDYKKALLNADPTDDTSLVSLFKLFSPEHLLKERESRDANQLDRNFYAELLHILGLHEHEVKGRKLISRLPEGKRQAGSLLEAIIEQLEARDKLGDIPSHLIPNGSSEERLFASAQRSWRLRLMGWCVG